MVFFKQSFLVLIVGQRTKERGLYDNDSLTFVNNFGLVYMLSLFIKVPCVLEKECIL